MRIAIRISVMGREPRWVSNVRGLNVIVNLQGFSESGRPPRLH